MTGEYFNGTKTEFCRSEQNKFDGTQEDITGYTKRDEDGNSLLCLGDIIICPEIAGINAEEYGHSFDREMAFLFAHSMLHLLGFDHMNPDDEKLMITYQKKIMCDIGMAFEDEIEFLVKKFDAYLDKFKKIIPADYKKMLGLTAEYLEQGMSNEEAQIEAFYVSLKKNA